MNSPTTKNLTSINYLKLGADIQTRHSKLNSISQVALQPVVPNVENKINDIGTRNQNGGNLTSRAEALGYQAANIDWVEGKRDQYGIKGYKLPKNANQDTKDQDIINWKNSIKGRKKIGK